MIWEGDVYTQISGDYRIDTALSKDGAHCVIKHRGEIIGYTSSVEKAKRLAEDHAK